MLKSDDCFAGCRIISLCGAGAYGMVYLVEDALKRRMALKAFHTGLDFEKIHAALLRYVSLPDDSFRHLLKIHHFGVEQGVFYYIMEAADNSAPDGAAYRPDTLAERLESQGRLSLQASLSIFQQALDALECLHSQGFVHRDVKPSNFIFINGTLKLGDPDLVGDYTRTLSAVGTLGFTPPDFFFSKQPKSPSGDLYALGKTLYCCVSGMQPERFPHYPLELPLDTLCHVATPLARICNPVPEQRPQTCAECRRLLPSVLPRHVLAWRRLTTRLAQSRPMRFLLRSRQPLPDAKPINWVKIRTALLTALLLLLVLLSNRERLSLLFQQLQSRYVEYRATKRYDAQKKKSDKNEEAKKEIPGDAFDRWKKRMPRLELQLDAALTAQIQARLDNAEALARQGQVDQAKQALDSLEELLRRQAEQSVPPDKEDFSSVGRMLGYLASPLGTDFLPAARQKKLLQKALADAKELTIPGSPCLGKEFRNVETMPFCLNFIPPGRYRSPVNGSLQSVDYPYWMFEHELTNEQYSYMFHYVCSRNDGNSFPIERMSWYDIIRYSQQLTGFLRMRLLLPPGYAFRPPTEAEWEFAALGGWAGQEPKAIQKASVLNSVWDDTKGNALGLKGMASNATEYVIGGYPELAPPYPCVIIRGVPPSPTKNALSGRSICHRDVMNVPNASFRLVLAPTEDDFFQREFSVPPVTIAPVGFHGRRLAAISTFAASNNFAMVREMAHACSAHLPEPASHQEWKEMFTATHANLGFPAFLGIEWRDNGWRRLSDGQAPAWPKLQPQRLPQFTCLAGTAAKTAPENPMRNLPTIFLEWRTEQEWQNRARNWMDGPCVERRFSVRDRQFLLVRLNLAPYAVPAFCQMLGLRPAVLSEPETRQEVLQKLADLDNPVYVGAAFHLDRWLWNDGTPVFKNLAHHPDRHPSSDLVASQAFDCLAIYKGELIRISKIYFILLDFSADGNQP